MKCSKYFSAEHALLSSYSVLQYRVITSSCCHSRVCRNVLFHTRCAVLVLICAVLTAHLCTVTIYSSAMLRPEPAGEASSAPPDLLVGFLGEKRRRKREERGGNMEKGG